MKNILFLFLVCGSFAFGQNAGYFGSKNSFSFSVSGVPTVRNTFSYDESSQIITSRRRFGFFTYNLSYNRTIKKRLELDLGYCYSNVRMYTVGELYEDIVYYTTGNGSLGAITTRYQYLDDPNFAYHQYNLGLKFYRLGSHAPMGKYIGFYLSYGSAKLDTFDLVLGYKNVPFESNRWVSKSTLDTYFSAKTSLDTKTFQFIFRVGRNFVVNKFLSIGGEIQMPLSTFFSFHGTKKYWTYRTPDEFFVIPDYTNLLELSVRRHNFLKFKFSANIHF